MSEHGCLSFAIGQDGPLGKKIKEIILQAETFIVYMDESDGIQWYTERYSGFSNELGSIANKISYWESIANKVFSKKDAYDYKSLLAEAYARILDDKNPVAANAIIDTTVDRMKKNGCEILKQAYMLSAFLCTIFLMALLISISLFKSRLVPAYFTPDAYEILLTALFGGIGAFVFVTFRFKAYSPEIEISKHVHRIDGCLRTFYGVVAGLIVCIAIKSNIVFGFLKDVPQSTYVSFFLGIVAGASEIFVPNLVKQMEDKNGKVTAKSESKTIDTPGRQAENVL